MPCIPYFNGSGITISLIGLGGWPNQFAGGTSISTTITTGNLIGGNDTGTETSPVPFTFVWLRMEGITITGPADTGAVMINAQHVAGFSGKHLAVTAPNAAHTATMGAGILMPVVGNNDQSVLDDVTVSGYYTGIGTIGEHSDLGRVIAVNGHDCFTFDLGTYLGGGVPYGVGSLTVRNMAMSNCTHGISAGVTQNSYINVLQADFDTSNTIDIYDPSNFLHGWLNFKKGSTGTTPTNITVTGATNLTLNSSWNPSDSIVQTGTVNFKNAPITGLASGAGGANSDCLTPSPTGGTIATFLCSIVGGQMAATLNTYFNGTNWIYAANGLAAAFRVEPNTGTTGGAFHVAVAPTGTAGGTLAMDTTNTAQWTEYTSAAPGTRTWFNSQAARPTFPNNNMSFAINPSANFSVDVNGVPTIGVISANTLKTNGSGVVSAGTFPWSCQPGYGDGLNAITAGTYLQSTCYNDTGQTVTLTAFKCFSDNNGTSSMNATNGAATALLTGAITCTTSFAAGTQSGTTTIANGDYIKFTFVADGTTKQSSFVVAGTHP